MPRGVTDKLAVGLPWFVGHFQKVRSVRCTYRFGSNGLVTFLCKKTEACCHDSCCPQTEAFYNLWYFWFSTVVFTMFISGVIYTCWQRCKQIKETEAWMTSHSQMGALKLHRIIESTAVRARHASEEDFSIS